jgi:hypothetical protein
MDDVWRIIGVLGGLLGGSAAIYTAVRLPAIERYRAQLRAEGYEHEVRFARLHERRVEKIDDIYRKLVDAERAFGSWTHPFQQAGEPTMDEKGQAAAAAANELRATFLYSRIWLDADLCARIAELDRELYHLFIDFTTYRQDDPRTQAERSKSWIAAFTKMQDEIPPLREAIETRFRDMLGVVGPP